MAEYIEREALLKSLCNTCDGWCENTACDCVNCKSEHRCDMVIEIAEAPAANVVPVVHGRWEYHDCVCTGDGLISVYACSACQGCIDEEAFDQLYAQNYCPNCGAHMKDGE